MTEELLAAIMAVCKTPAEISQAMRGTDGVRDDLKEIEKRRIKARDECEAAIAAVHGRCKHWVRKPTIQFGIGECVACGHLPPMESCRDQ